MWYVKLGRPNGGDMVVTVSATNETQMKQIVRAQYPGHQIRNYSRM